MKKGVLVEDRMTYYYYYYWAYYWLFQLPFWSFHFLTFAKCIVGFFLSVKGLLGEDNVTLWA